jgi:hypothetical protein
MSWNNESKHYIIAFLPDQGTEKHVHMGGIKKKMHSLGIASNILAVLKPFPNPNVLGIKIYSTII